MNIYQVLHKDHKKVTELLNQLVVCSKSDNEKWKSLVDRIRDELIPHSRAEEAVFYNAIREVNPESGVIFHSYTEHAKIEADLRTLQAVKAADFNWTELTKKLRKDVLHHIEEEEGEVFPAAQKIFTEEEALMIGNAFKHLKPAVKEQSFVGTTLDLISNLLPRRLVFRFSEKTKRSA